MVITETIKINDIEYIRNYSDTGHYIERDGVKYGEAIDPVGTDRVYTETDELIESESTNSSDEATEQDYLEALSEMGVNVNEEI